MPAVPPASQEDGASAPTPMASGATRCFPQAEATSRIAAAVSAFIPSSALQLSSTAANTAPAWVRIDSRVRRSSFSRAAFRMWDATNRRSCGGGPCVRDTVGPGARSGCGSRGARVKTRGPNTRGPRAFVDIHPVPRSCGHNIKIIAAWQWHQRARQRHNRVGVRTHCCHILLCPSRICLSSHDLTARPSNAVDEGRVVCRGHAP
eukprot:scaffold8106_cov107-Isochrysis_galbana.AAC.4